VCLCHWAKAACLILYICPIRVLSAAHRRYFREFGLANEKLGNLHGVYNKHNKNTDKNSLDDGKAN
jgi:hypothetical protein